MYSKFLKKGIALGVLTSAVLIPNDKVLAAEAKNAEGVSTVNINKGYLANATAEIERYVETELEKCVRRHGIYTGGRGKLFICKNRTISGQ